MLETDNGDIDNNRMISTTEKHIWARASLSIVENLARVILDLINPIKSVREVPRSLGRAAKVVTEVNISKNKEIIRKRSQVF